jgi:acyl carrier protein
MDDTGARALITAALGRVAPEIDPSSIDPDAELQVECDLDSIDFLNLVEQVSSSIGRDIPESDFPQLVTLDRFAAYLVRSTVTDAR